VHVFVTLLSHVFRTQSLFFFFTLILQQKAPSVVKPLWSDKVEGQHVRIRDNSHTRGGATELEESAAAIPHSHDVHAVSISIWTCDLFVISISSLFALKRVKSDAQGRLFFRRGDRCDTVIWSVSYVRLRYTVCV